MLYKFSVVKTFILFLLLLVSWTTKAVESVDNKNPNSITIVTNNYEPYIDDSKPDKGHLSRLVTDAFALVGIKTDYLFVPWPRADDIVHRGKESALMYYGKSAEKEKLFFFSQPIFTDDWLFFHLKTTPVRWEKLSDLSHLTIGAIRSYTYSKEFHQLARENKLRVHWLSYDEQNWRMLMAGRVDLIPHFNIGWHQLRKIYDQTMLDKITTHPKLIKKQLNYLLFSKAHPHSEYYRKMFNLGFAKLKQAKSLSSYSLGHPDQPWPVE